MSLITDAETNPLQSLLTPSVAHRLMEARGSEEAWLESQGDRAVAGNSTVIELRREMRRDHLEMASLPNTGHDSTDFESRLLSTKYRAVLDPVRPDAAEISLEWEAARSWAAERVGTDIWLGECDLGQTRHFVSESAHGLETALRHLGVSVCYDLRVRAPRFVLASGEHLEMNDRNEGALRELVAELYCFVRRKSGSKRPKAIRAMWSNSRWRTSLDALLNRNEVDPFAEWLRKLPPWDGTVRLEGWLRSCGFDFGDTDPELAAWAGRSILMAAVSRTFEPGAKHDTIPVLVGPQGSGKSTALAWLLPPDRRLEWFNDNLRLSADEKSKVESLQGAVIVEVSEMTGATTADIESLKAFLSRSSDRVRLAYRRNPEASPRRCAIVGTANGSAVLPNDPTGNRRFVALGIRGGAPAVARAWLDAEREQLWAEAFARSREGEEIWFPEELAPRQRAANERFRSGDVILEDAVLAWMNMVDDGLPREWTMKEIAEEVGMVRKGESAQSMPVSQTRRLGRVLGHFGCERVLGRRDGRVTRMWRVPETLPETAEAYAAPKPETGAPDDAI